MGCTTSKLDDLPAVALCRERCAFLNQAMNQRYVLAEAHVAYIHSLKGVGHSLQNFIHEDFTTLSGSPPSPPELALPPQKKKQSAAVEVAAGPSSSHPHHSHSNSGSHLEFHSDSDEEDDTDHELGSLHHSDHSSPLHSDGDNPHMGYMDSSDPGGPVSFPGKIMHMNYMKKSSTPSVVYQQRPVSSETIYMGESSSYYPYPPYPNMNPNPASSPPQAYPYYGYQIYGAPGNYGSPPRYPFAGPSSPQRQSASVSSSKPAPPPPPPPKASTWDFFNPFDSYEGEYYSQNTPSRDSKELREEEGIPDLEDVNYQHEVVKEVHGDQKFVDDATAHHSKPVMNEEVVNREEGSLYQTRPSVSMVDDGLEFDVHVMEKKVVDNQKIPEERSGGDGLKARRVSRDALEVAREIQLQFDRASESGIEIAKMFEVGKHPYQRKHGLYQGQYLFSILF